MTNDEARTILRQMATAFPHIQDYINGLSDSTATLTEWRRMLEPIKHAHAVEAVERMRMGRAEPPKWPSEIGTLPLWVRSIAGRVAMDFAKVESMKRIEAHTDERRAVGGYDNLAELMRMSLCNGSSRREGKITDAEFEENKRYFMAMSQHKDRKPEVPDSLKAIYQTNRRQTA
jgi:hypothetical protein